MASETDSYRFAGEKEAAEFLAEKIATEARQQGVPFSSEERRFLFYDPKRPETGAGLQAIIAIEDDSYDDKVTPLLKSAYEHDRDFVGEQAKYTAALEALDDSGLYILFVAEDALAEPPPPPASGRGALLLTLLGAIVLVLAIVLLMKYK